MPRALSRASRRGAPVRRAILVLYALAGAACAAGGSWSDADSAEVTGALARFRAAWLANDTATILAGISDDMVLYVPGPAGTLRGRPAVRDYWFPPSGDTVYPIVRYESLDERVTGSGDVAVVEGRSVLGWSMVVRGTTVSTTTNTSDFMTLLRREDGRWRIARNIFVPRP